MIANSSDLTGCQPLCQSALHCSNLTGCQAPCQSALQCSNLTGCQQYRQITCQNASFKASCLSTIPHCLPYVCRLCCLSIFLAVTSRLVSLPSVSLPGYQPPCLSAFQSGSLPVCQPSCLSSSLSVSLPACQPLVCQSP